jgi:hypothetical protein
MLWLAGGVALVLVHNVWTSDWRVVIALISWITILRGVLTMLWPQSIPAIGGCLIESRGTAMVVAAAASNLG